MIDHGTKCNGQPCTCGAKQIQPGELHPENNRMDWYPSEDAEHGLGRVHLETGLTGMVVCHCGARFDGFGTFGALNKLAGHCLNNGVQIDIAHELAKL